MRAAVAAVGVLLIVATAAIGQIYQWTDSAGVLHYTTDFARIPEEHRATVRSLDSRPRDPGPDPIQPPGTIPLSAGGPVLVSASLNGVALTLLVDTGADRTLLSPAALARAGIERAGGRPVRVVGVGGTIEATEVVLDRIDVVGTRLGPLAVIVHDVPAPGADGLLGRDLLGHFTLTVDGTGGRATLVPR